MCARISSRGAVRNSLAAADGSMKYSATKSRREKPGVSLLAAYLRMMSAGAVFAVASANVLLSAKILSVCTRSNSAPYSSEGERGAASRACALPQSNASCSATMVVNT